MSESTQLSVPERAAIALGAAEHEKALIVLSKKYADITKIVNAAGREQCHSAYMELKNTRVAIEKAGKDAREDANAFQKAVIEEVKRLTAITADEEARLQALRDEFDAERERERAAKAAAEKERVDAIRKRIAEMQAIPSMLVGKQSQTIATAIEGLESVEITLESFQEFAGEAETAKVAAIAKMGEMLTAQLAVEAEQKRLAEERAQLERERAEATERECIAAAARAEQEARDRAERERIEAAARAEREAEQRKLDEQRAELARQQAAIDAERQRQADDAARIEREKQAAIEAEAARIAAEEQRKREAEAAEQARREREAREAAEAEAREKARRIREDFELNGPHASEMLEVLAAHYQVEQETVLQWINRWVWAEVEVAA